MPCDLRQLLVRRVCEIFDLQQSQLLNRVLQRELRAGHVAHLVRSLWSHSLRKQGSRQAHTTMRGRSSLLPARHFVHRCSHHSTADLDTAHLRSLRWSQSRQVESFASLHTRSTARERAQVSSQAAKLTHPGLALKPLAPLFSHSRVCTASMELYSPA